jgi:hypothetical protein
VQPDNTGFIKVFLEEEWVNLNLKQKMIWIHI